MAWTSTSYRSAKLSPGRRGGSLRPVSSTHPLLATPFSLQVEASLDSVWCCLPCPARSSRVPARSALSPDGGTLPAAPVPAFVTSRREMPKLGCLIYALVTTTHYASSAEISGPLAQIMTRSQEHCWRGLTSLVQACWGGLTCQGSLQLRCILSFRWMLLWHCLHQGCSRQTESLALCKRSFEFWCLDLACKCGMLKMVLNCRKGCICMSLYAKDVRSSLVHT